jgi:DNA primase
MGEKGLQTLFPELLILNTQNESLSCYNDKLIEKIQGKKVYINYDSDEAGIKASWRVNQKYPWMLHVNVPYEYLPLKDWSDVYKKLGPVPIIEHMKRKGIIE